MIEDKQQWIQDTANDLMYFDSYEQIEAYQIATDMYNALHNTEVEDEQ